MGKFFVYSDMDWEAYKLLSRTELTDDELDVFYFLTNHFWFQNGLNGTSNDLYALLSRSTNEKIKKNISAIKAYIKKFSIKK